MIEFIEGKKVIEFDDFYGEVQLAASATDTQIFRQRTRVGLKGYIVGYHQAWDAGGDRLVTLHLQINGVRRPPYDSTTVQLAPPELDENVPVPIPIEQNSEIRVSGDNSDASNAYYATARVRVLYVSNI